MDAHRNAGQSGIGKSGPATVNQGLMTLDTAGYVPAGAALVINGSDVPLAAVMVVKLENAAGSLSGAGGIVAKLHAGYNGGNWNAASGITSTSASAENMQAIGYATGCA